MTNLNDYDTPEALRGFLKLCLNPPYGDKRTPVRLAEVLPEPLARKVAEFSPHLRGLQHFAKAVEEQAQAAHRAYADALAAWIHSEEPTPAADTGERYVIGRSGVFATLYDRHEERLVVDNATEEHCGRVRDELLAAWWKPAPAGRRSMPLLEAVAAAFHATKAHVDLCGTCHEGMRLAEMCAEGQAAAVASLDTAPATAAECAHEDDDEFRTVAGVVLVRCCRNCGERLAPVAERACAHVAWEVTSEYRNVRQMWVKSRRCADCGEGLAPAVELEPHWPDKALSTCPGFQKEYQGVSDAKRRMPRCMFCRQPRAAHPETEAHGSADQAESCV